MRFIQHNSAAWTCPECGVLWSRFPMVRRFLQAPAGICPDCARGAKKY